MDDFPSIIADIVRDCLQFEPSSRPTANDIAERLARWQFRKYDLNRDENGNTDIHRLASNSPLELADLLRSWKLKPIMVNAMNHLGETPLMLVKDTDVRIDLLRYRKVPLSNGEPSRVMECHHNIDIFGTLLKLAEKEDVDTINSYGESLAYVGSIVYKVFEQRKQENGHHDTPLHIAAKIGNVALFEALVGLRVFDAWEARADGRTALHVASLHGHVEIMRKLIDPQDSSQGEEEVELCINIQDGRGKTALHLAAASGVLSATRTLLGHSATNVNLRDADERSPIFDAVLATNIDASARALVVQAFVQHPNVDLNMKDSRGETVFHQLARSDIIQLAQILSERDDLKLYKREREHWYTPVHLAVRSQSFRVARLWLTRDDVDVNQVDKHGNTILHILAALSIPALGNIGEDLFSNHNSLISFAHPLVLRADIDLNLHNTRGDTPLHVAIQCKNFIVAELLLSDPKKKLLINASNKRSMSALHLAAHKNMVNAVKTILSREDVDADCRNENKQTPLHLASKKNATEVAKLLLSRDDVDVNARDEREQAPLHLASTNNAADVAKLLLSRDDADVNARDEWQQTPLHCSSETNAAEVATMLLLRDDVDVNARDINQRTPLHLVSEKNAAEVAKLLISRNDVDVNARDKEQLAPLHYSLEMHAAEVATILLSRDDVDVSARNEHELTPLHFASMHDAPEVAKLLISRNDVDVNARDNDGWTPLHYACEEHAPQVATMLLSRDNIDVNARDKNGKTALDISEEENSYKCAPLLRARGATSRLTYYTDTDTESDESED